MATKNYVSIGRLTEYDGFIKAKIDKNDASTLESAKSYTNEQIAKIPSVDAYTKTEMNNALNNKSDKDHNHDNVYDIKGSASSALSGAKTYTDEIINTHTNNSDIHFTATERTKLSGIEAGAQANTITGVKGNSESSYRTGNVNITKSNIGLGNVDNTSDTNKPVSTAQQAAIDGALAEAKTYVDGKIDAVMGEGASTTLDTIGEISAAIEAHQDVTDALNAAIGNKANVSDLTSHTGNKSNPHGVTKAQLSLGNVENKSSATIRSEITKSNVTTALGYTPYTQAEVDGLLDDKVDKVSGKVLSTNDYTTTEKTKLSGIDEGAQVNQNAFSNVKVGSTTVVADTTTDTLEISAGSGISVAGDATNDKVTITNSGVRSISTGGTNGTISVNTNGSSAEVAVKGLGSAAYTASTAYAAASHGTHVTWSTTSPKMNGTAAVGSETKVARGDHVHPTDTSRASQTDLDALEAVVDGKAPKTHSHAISDVTNLQSTLDGKQATITGGATTIASSNLAASRALVSNSSGKVAVSAVTSTELGYLDGVTSNIQTQLDGKAASSHGTHVSYGTSASALGTSSAGSASTVSRSDHVHAFPALTSCTGTLTVAKGGTGATTAAAALTNLGLTATATELNYCDGVTSAIQTQLDGKAASSHNHSGSNITSGTVAAARLPVASSSASGIVNTSAQSFKGTKTFADGIKIGGATFSYDSTAKAVVISFD